MMVLAWRILGWPLAFHKAAVGDTVPWIGSVFRFSPSEVVVQVPDDKLQELAKLVEQVLRINVVGDTDLRSLAGNIQSLSSLFFALRPFCAELRAALYSASEGALVGNTWVAQLRHTLLWLAAFFAMHAEGPPFARSGRRPISTKARTSFLQRTRAHLEWALY